MNHNIWMFSEIVWWDEQKKFADLNRSTEIGFIRYDFDDDEATIFFLITALDCCCNFLQKKNGMVEMKKSLIEDAFARIKCIRELIKEDCTNSPDERVWQIVQMMGSLKDEDVLVALKDIEIFLNNAKGLSKVYLYLG